MELDELRISFKAFSLHELRELGREILKTGERHDSFVELVRTEISTRVSNNSGD